MDNYQQSQKNKLFKPEHGDPYLEPTPQGTSHCPQCGAVHHQGRWSWQQVVPNEAQQQLCPNTISPYIGRAIDQGRRHGT